MTEVCNFCGASASDIRTVGKCAHCSVAMCSNCKSSHESACASKKKLTDLGIGPTVRGGTYEHRKGHETPEVTPPPTPRILTKPAILGAPYEKEAQEKYLAKISDDAMAAANKRVNEELDKIIAASQGGAAVDPNFRIDNDPRGPAPTATVAKAINEASVAAIQESFRKGDDNEKEVQSISEPVPESKQDGNASSVIDGSKDGDGSDSVSAADDTRHDSDASGDGGNAPGAPEPEVIPGV